MELEVIKKLAMLAGRAILDVYNTDFSVDYKDDNSPLTKADCLSHEIILDGLSGAFSGIPVISEETGRQEGYKTRSKWSSFWLVDPLDGTKEFVKRNGEFTVNIALIENSYPVMGVIYVPVTGVLYYASRGGGAWKRTPGVSGDQQIHARRMMPDKPVVVVTSRSHPSKELEKYLEAYSVKSVLSAGSSLKFCLVAEGRADIYPRLGPTMEWDTAAGQTIVEEAGGRVLDMDGRRFIYNKESLKNGHFIVEGAKDK